MQSYIQYLIYIYNTHTHTHTQPSLWLSGKESNAGTAGTSHRGGHGNPLQLFLPGESHG